MKAIILEQAWGVENLLYKDIDTPNIEKDEILIETRAIGINPVDFKMRSIGAIIDMLYWNNRPVILGWDIAGIVTKVWSEVTNFQLGDRVFGMVNFPGAWKAYAEYVAAPENQITKIPENVSFEDAAATTLAALTALQALQGNVKPGERVFIHAGSGWVGHFAIQMAKHFWAHVTTTSSAKNKDFVLSLGADEHIDYRSQNFEEVCSDMDFVLDSLWGETLKKSVHILKDGGRVISLPDPQSVEAISDVAGSRNIDASWLLVKSSAENMMTLAKMLDSWIISPTIANTYSFDEMREAHSELETGRTVWKIVITL